MTPDWMQEPNWENKGEPLPETVWVQFNNGQIHPTTNRQHLVRWMRDYEGRIVEQPQQPEAQP